MLIQGADFVACIGPGEEVPAGWLRGGDLWLRLDARTADGEPVVGDRVDAYPTSTPPGWQLEPGDDPRVLRLRADRASVRDGWLRVTAFGRTVAAYLPAPR